MKPYRPRSVHLGATIKSLFELLRRIHGPFVARALLTDALEAVDVVTDPPLPTSWRLRLMQDNTIAVETPDGLLDTGQIYVRGINLFPGRNLRAATTFHVSARPAAAPAAAVNDAAAGKQPTAAEPVTTPVPAAVEPISDTPAPAGEPADDDPIADAIAALRPFSAIKEATSLEQREHCAAAYVAVRLKPDDSVMRDIGLDDCKTMFGVSGKRYFSHVLPAARKLAGLPPLGKPGPKRQSPTPTK